MGQFDGRVKWRRCLLLMDIDTPFRLTLLFAPPPAAFLAAFLPAFLLACLSALPPAASVLHPDAGIHAGA